MRGRGEREGKKGEETGRESGGSRKKREGMRGRGRGRGRARERGRAGARVHSTLIIAKVEIADFRLTHKDMKFSLEIKRF